MSSNQEKKIMFVIPTLEGGGAERVASILLNELSKRGINIVLVLFSKKSSYGIPDTIRVRHIDIRPHKSIIYTVFKFFFIVLNLSKIIREEKPYNILSFIEYTNIVVLLSNMLIFNKSKVIISVRTSPTLYFHKFSMSFWDNVVSVLMRLLYNKANMIISVSEFIKNDLIENFGIKKEKIVTIYNPVDMDRINVLAEENLHYPWFKEDIPVIVAVGRLSKEKGMDYLLKAIAIVKGKTSVRLIVVGEGEEKEHLKDLTKKLDIESNVFFAGFDRNPYKYMKRATIFVLPSLVEGFPNALIEAMACGVPVISTIYNPCPHEIIEHEKNGLLVPPAKVEALAEAIFRLLSAPEERKRFVDTAKETVKKYSIEKIVDQYEKSLGY